MYQLVVKSLWNANVMHSLKRQVQSLQYSQCYCQWRKGDALCASDHPQLRRINGKEKRWRKELVEWSRGLESLSGVKRGKCLCLCRRQHGCWECGTWCVNVSKRELQEKKNNSWNYGIMLAKTKWIKNELPAEIEKRNPPVKGGALDQPSSGIEVKILKCFCAGHWAGLGEYKIDLAWQSWHFLSHWPTTFHQSCVPTQFSAHTPRTQCAEEISGILTKSWKFWIILPKGIIILASEHSHSHRSSFDFYGKADFISFFFFFSLQSESWFILMPLWSQPPNRVVERNGHGDDPVDGREELCSPGWLRAEEPAPQQQFFRSVKLWGEVTPQENGTRIAEFKVICT